MITTIQGDQRVVRLGAQVLLLDKEAFPDVSGRLHTRTAASLPFDELDGRAPQSHSSNGPDARLQHHDSMFCVDALKSGLNPEIRAKRLPGLDQ